VIAARGLHRIRIIMDRIPDADGPPTSDVSALLHHIGQDMKTIASNELELLRNKLAHHTEMVITRAAVVWLGAMVGLIGLAMLCVVAVVALAPVIPPLWPRLLIMAVVYLVIGGTIAGISGGRLAKSWRPDLSEPIETLKRAAASVKEGLSVKEGVSG